MNRPTIIMDVGALITAVSRRATIWDKKVPSYSNRTAVDRCWMDISAELGVDEAMLRRKWKYLRDNFTVEYGKVLQARREDAAHGRPPTKSRWQYFPLLMFLKNVVTPRLSHTYGFLTHPHSPLGIDQGEDSEHFSVIEDNSNSNTKQEFAADEPERDAEEYEVLRSPSTPTEAPLPTGKKRKRKLRSTAERDHALFSSPKRLDVSGVEENSWEYQYQSNIANVEEDEDDDLMFFKSLLPHVRLISQTVKLKFRNQIQSLVQEYAYSTTLHHEDKELGPFPIYAPQQSHGVLSSPSPSHSNSPSTSAQNDTSKETDGKPS